MTTTTATGAITTPATSTGDPTAGTSVPTPPPPAAPVSSWGQRVPRAVWSTVSRAMTDETPVIANREDLLVRVSPGAGHGAPACFLPAEARIEIDGNLFEPTDPATITPELSLDRTRYAPVWGALVHECAHAQHTRWDPPPDTPPGVAAAAVLLEESRIEAGQLRRRPDDRYYLRATVRTIVAPSLTTPSHTPPTNTPDVTATPVSASVPAPGSVSVTGDAPGTGAGSGGAPSGGLSRADAASLAGLVLARVDAGVLDPDEVAPLVSEVKAVLGANTVHQLRGVWCEAHTLADDDAAGMVRLGRAWCEIAGLDPGESLPAGCRTPAPAETPPTGAQSAGALPGPVETVLDAIAAKVATEVPAPDAASEVLARRVTGKAETQHRKNAQRKADKVFTDERLARSAAAGTRAPGTAERGAARRIARALDNAGIRDRVKITTSSTLPPGRLRMRGALVADAQRAAGAIPTAHPFARVTRRVVPAPPLRVGIACDVSGSMRRFTEPVASAAWILANAAHLSRVEATTATVTFGRYVQPITRPGTPPRVVTEFRAHGSFEVVDEAVNTLDGALDLAGTGAVRLLVIVSDGNYRPTPRANAQRYVDRLITAGCGLLWLAPASGNIKPLIGATVHRVTDPATTGDVIARAAAAALRR